jgi:hypothetical protein
LSCPVRVQPPKVITHFVNEFLVHLVHGSAEPQCRGRPGG